VKQPVTTTAGVVTPFPLIDATRAGELLFACLYGVESMSRHLQHTPLFVSLQKLLDSKVSGILKKLFATNEIPLLWRELPLRKPHPAGEARGTPDTNWAKLIKTAVASSPADRPDHNARAERLSGYCGGSDLAGRRVLCVGGRAALYPEYRRTVKTTGGSLLIYRGDQQHDPDCLPALLACADALLCPVDCVNHTAYFAVKRYCEHSGKPCALLEHSDLPTFRKGVEALSASTTSAPVIPFSNH